MLAEERSQSLYVWNPETTQGPCSPSHPPPTQRKEGVSPGAGGRDHGTRGVWWLPRRANPSVLRPKSNLAGTLLTPHVQSKPPARLLKPRWPFLPPDGTFHPPQESEVWRLLHRHPRAHPLGAAAPACSIHGQTALPHTRAPSPPQATAGGTCLSPEPAVLTSGSPPPPRSAQTGGQCDWLNERSRGRQAPGKLRKSFKVSQAIHCPQGLARVRLWNQLLHFHTGSWRALGKGDSGL